jgi:SAM-dependent methyltransferase
MNFFSKKPRQKPLETPSPPASIPPHLQPTTPCCPAEVHPYEIADFFAFRDVIFGRVAVEHAPGDPPRITLMLPGGRWLPVVQRPDPDRVSTDVRTCLAFSACAPSGITSKETESIALFVHFRGEHLNIASPSWGRLQGDGFTHSQSDYWEQIRAMPPGARMLEIGSRARSGIVRRSLFPDTMEYVGFDIVAGPNVDVVGDAHRLSEYFPAGHFDAAFSVSVWEHLAMPWKVSLELNRVLKTGGIAMINTHQSWPSHEEPWDYFRFSEYAWPPLFNAATGFEILASGMGMPAVIASALAVPHIQDQGIEWHYGYLATRCVIRKIGPTSLEWPVDPKIVASGAYPG